MLKACSPGEVVCITCKTHQDNSRFINRLSKVLKRSQSVVKVSASKCIVDGKLSTKLLTLEILCSVRITAYTQSKIHHVQEVKLQMALEDALITKKTRYVLITNIQKALDLDSNNITLNRTLCSWKFLAQSTGIVLVFSHVEKTHGKKRQLDNKGE